jgi:hypothetical protein
MAEEPTFYSLNQNGWCLPSKVDKRFPPHPCYMSTQFIAFREISIERLISKNITNRQEHSIVHAWETCMLKCSLATVSPQSPLLKSKWLVSPLQS